MTCATWHHRSGQRSYTNTRQGWAASLPRGKTGKRATQSRLGWLQLELSMRQTIWLTGTSHICNTCGAGPQRVTTSLRRSTTSKVNGHEGEPHHAHVLHTGEGLKSDISLRACFSQPPSSGRVCIANAANARGQTGNSQIGGARWKAPSPGGRLMGCAQRRDMIERVR